jgi:hypothetical protein
LAFQVIRMLIISYASSTNVRFVGEHLRTYVRFVGEYLRTYVLYTGATDWSGDVRIVRIARAYINKEGTARLRGPTFFGIRY